MFWTWFLAKTGILKDLGSWYSGWRGCKVINSECERRRGQKRRKCLNFVFCMKCCSVEFEGQDIWDCGIIRLIIHVSHFRTIIPCAFELCFVIEIVIFVLFKDPVLLQICVAWKQCMGSRIVWWRFSVANVRGKEDSWRELMGFSPKK